MNIFELANSITPSIKVDIPHLSGEPTGETLTLKHPSSGIMARAFEVYVREMNRIRKQNKELLDKGEESGDYSEYNAVAAPEITRLEMAFCVTSVDGWSMDNDPTDEAVQSLLEALPHLVELISVAEWKAKGEQAKK